MCPHDSLTEQEARRALVLSGVEVGGGIEASAHRGSRQKRPSKSHTSQFFLQINRIQHPPEFPPHILKVRALYKAILLK